MTNATLIVTCAYYAIFLRYTLRTIAITNQKGGSGKTTTAVNVAAALGEQGHRVLLLDLDPQASASSWLGCTNGDRGLLDVFTDNVHLSDLARRTNVPNVDIVPASTWLVGVDKAVASEVGSETLLRQAFAQLDDTLGVRPGRLPTDPRVSLGRRVRGVSGHPGPGRDPGDGAGWARGSDPHGRPCPRTPELEPPPVGNHRVPSRPAHQSLSSDPPALRERFGDLVLQSFVRENVRLAEAPSFEQPITVYAPESSGAVTIEPSPRSFSSANKSESDMSKRWSPIGVDPLDSLLGAPSSAGQRRAAASPRRAPRVRATFHLPLDLVEEARNATVALSGPPTRLTLARLVETALRREVERLRHTHHAGEPFPPREADLVGGRPSAREREPPVTFPRWTFRPLEPMQGIAGASDQIRRRVMRASHRGARPVPCSEPALSLYKRGSIWYYDFWFKGHRRNASTSQVTRSDAEQFERDIKRGLRRQLAGLEAPPAQAAPTFQDWAEIHYRERIRHITRPDFLEHSINVVLRFWGTRPSDGGVPEEPYHNLRLDDPIREPAWIERFEAWMRARGSSPQTRNHYRSTLRGITGPRCFRPTGGAAASPSTRFAMSRATACPSARSRSRSRTSANGWPPPATTSAWPSRSPPWRPNYDWRACWR